MNNRIIPLAIGFILLAALPYWIPGVYYLNVASQILFYAVFAIGVNILAGYAGLVSLGHAALFGVAAYTTGYMLQAGFGHPAAILTAFSVTALAAAVYAVVSLRTSGIGYIMITLAIGQIAWGLAYRWISVTNGDNGVSLHGRPAPFGIALSSPTAFYYTTLIVFLISIAAVAIFVRSPMGAALKGTRDQARRMNALGYHVWATMFSALLTTAAAILFVYYNQFMSPQTVALTASAEVLLMVIAGGASTLFGPAVGAALVVIVKNVVSAYITRWNFLLGAIFVAIVIFMPEGLVPGSVRLWRLMFSSRSEDKSAQTGVTEPSP
jgi:branched-chain amino acid transport system permease protein